MADRKYFIEDVESFFHQSNGDKYKVLNIAVTKDGGLLLKIAEGKTGGERQQIVISLSVEELLRLAKICEIVAEKMIEKRIEDAYSRMK